MMKLAAAALILVGPSLVAGAASAQPIQGLRDSVPATGGGSALAAPSASPEVADLSLSASFARDERPIRSGLVWRVFADSGIESTPKLVAKSSAAAPTILLAPGPYTVHVSYGFASASKRISLNATGAAERLALTAGALKLAGAIGDVPIPPNRIAFSVYLPLGTDSEGRLVARNVKAGEVVRLPEGSYHVVSTYGESNAIMRVDLKVDPGRLTDATVNHRAATLTLKLVAASGGEAFAGTAFSVLTPGGDVIREAIGAFPSVTLAEGDYVLIARHDGRVYTREFKVESGLDRDIEVLATAS